MIWPFEIIQDGGGLSHPVSRIRIACWSRVSSTRDSRLSTRVFGPAVSSICSNTNRQHHESESKKTGVFPSECCNVVIVCAGKIFYLIYNWNFCGD